MTLAEFLLARIAEDEEYIPAVLDDSGLNDWGGTIEFGPADRRGKVTFDPARVLAECEAKRRIVEREINSRTKITYRRRMVLQDLAAIYADHPDYREEWKP